MTRLGELLGVVGVIGSLVFRPPGDRVLLGASPGGEATDDVVRRARFMRWAWAEDRFIFNPDFQVFVDSIIGPID